MATITYALAPDPSVHFRRVAWLAMGGADVGQAYADGHNMPDRSVQVLGTFGGATVTIEGSNDGGTTWATLRDPFGNDLSFTAAGLKGVAELPQQIRPKAAGGTASAIDVYLLMRGDRP